MLWLTLSYAVIVVIPFIGIYVVTTIVVVYGFGVSGVGGGNVVGGYGECIRVVVVIHYVVVVISHHVDIGGDLVVVVISVMLFDISLLLILLGLSLTLIYILMLS